MMATARERTGAYVGIPEFQVGVAVYTPKKLVDEG